jgi:hypothetical protein
LQEQNKFLQKQQQQQQQKTWYMAHCASKIHIFKFFRNVKHVFDKWIKRMIVSYNN